jgi:hypothetical protein
MRIPGQDDKMRTSRLVLGAALVSLLLAGSHFVRVSGLLGVGLLFAVTAGCGLDAGKTVSLSGNVTIGGKPIPSDAQAFITFATKSDGAERSVSVPIKEGRYESPRTPQGQVFVSFRINRTGPEKMSERTGELYRDIISLLPRNQTGESVLVEEDNSDLDFDL